MAADVVTVVSVAVAAGSISTAFSEVVIVKVVVVVTKYYTGSSCRNSTTRL